MASPCPYDKQPKLFYRVWETLLWPWQVLFSPISTFSVTTELSLWWISCQFSDSIHSGLWVGFSAKGSSLHTPPTTPALPMCVLPVRTSGLSLNIPPSNRHFEHRDLKFSFCIFFLLFILYQVCTLLVLRLLAHDCFIIFCYLFTCTPF